MPTEELSLYVAIGVTIPARDARGRATRLGPVLDEILSAHNYPPVIERLLAEAQSYFAQSEQIPSLVRLAAEKRDGRWTAGGLLFQHLPEGEEGRERIHTQLDHPDWPHVAILAGSVKAEELTNADLPLDDLIWRLFHEEAEVRTLAPIPLRRGCRCDPDYVRSVIARFPEDERREMVGPDGLITVDCAFCSQSFPITLEDVS